LADEEEKMLHKVRTPVGAGTVFSPEESRQLILTFARFWEAISFAFPDANSERTREVRERLAGLVLRMAWENKKAERNLGWDPERFCIHDAGFDKAAPAARSLVALCNER
jgi:hypothetical protein